MSGGMSHLDAFNAQPGTDEAGPVKRIKTSADGVQISEYLPLTSKHMHHVAIINSAMSTKVPMPKLLHAHQLHAA